MSEHERGGATVVVAVRDGERSRRTVRWAAEHLFPRSKYVILVHVITRVSAVPSPDGRLVPADQLDPDVVRVYIEDRKLKARQLVFAPLIGFCRGQNVETLVLEGKDPLTALLGFVVESDIENLVVGSASITWLKRLLGGPIVAKSIMKSAPNSCNVYVVSRKKLTIKYTNQSVDDGCDGHITLSHTAFARIERNSALFRQIFLRGSKVREMSQASEVRSAASFEEDTMTLELQKLRQNGALAFARNTSSAVVQPAIEADASAEVVKLRSELEKALAKYNQTCEELVHVSKKVVSLSAECYKESKKFMVALESEQLLQERAAEESAKYLQVMKELQEAKELLAKETLDRHKAEILAAKMSLKKSKVVETIFSDNKRFRRYSENEIEAATDNFSDTRKIGEGSYGDIYKAELDHTPVAIKVLRMRQTDAYDKNDEFLREVEILSQLHHPHMVLLLGMCPEICCLVYEYMENGSLEDKLFKREDKQPLPWFIRFRIVFEVACGLAFLHNTKPEPIVHRDLKPGNILLDQNYISKIGDVGLAKLVPDIVPDSQTVYKETVLAGTFYYMDPEYQRTGTIRPKSDLYALGIIALQLLTARRPERLILTVDKAINNGSLSNILDSSVFDWPLVEAERLAKLALKCSRLRSRDRPDLEKEVLPELEELANMANVCLKLRRNNYTPSDYLCPILQDIMDSPYIAADGYTYEYIAIKAWLEKHNVSPVTKATLPHTIIVPNHSLQSAIQEWESQGSILNFLNMSHIYYL